MSHLEEFYPVSCAFCKIASAYPPSSPSPIPTTPDPEKVSPQCHLLLSHPHLLAFLDILPLAPGHILLTTRHHYEKISDLYPQTPSASDLATSRALGEYIPILSQALVKVTGIEDWNVVQNNGARAAQVVPHVHFHLIPRYQEGRREEAKGNAGMGMSWRMFGRGPREELDEEEGEELAGRLREALRRVMGEGRGSRL